MEVGGPGFSQITLWVPSEQTGETRSLLIGAGFEER